MTNKLVNTTFTVLFNKQFEEYLDRPQIAWMVQQAANVLTTDKWFSNQYAHERDGELDCWQHDAVMEDGPCTLEAVPFPEDCLSLWLKNRAATTPVPGHPNTIEMKYPDDFTQWLEKDRKELGVFRVEDLNECH